MCDESTHAVLEAILQELQHQDNYTYSDPMTAGGPTGNYIIASPYNEECEWALLMASSGSSGAGVGSFTLAPRASQPALHNDGTDNLGKASNGTMNNVLPAIAAQMGNNTNVPYTPVWVPLTGVPSLFLAISAAAATTITVTVVFRRQNNPVKFANRPQSGGHRMGGRQERHATQIQQSLSELQEESRRGQGYNARAGIRR